MGRWFPGFRTGTPEQVKTFRDACIALFRNSRYQQAAGIRTETTRFLDLNDRVCATERPLSRAQRSWHWHRALDAEDRDFTRLQRASDQQNRAMRRSR